ncbi:hypothetical protein [Methylobacterium durans]|uniref:hypothetical protein n=1 Tax=Methylobacterium durans TaxID=2202825 RepID=UPI0013A5A759|nr:hypothetical protein [Methylobacterium durans]
MSPAPPPPARAGGAGPAAAPARDRAAASRVVYVAGLATFLVLAILVLLLR